MLQQLFCKKDDVEQVSLKKKHAANVACFFYANIPTFLLKLSMRAACFFDYYFLSFASPKLTLQGFQTLSGLA